MNKIKDFLNSLEEREKNMVIICFIFTTSFIIINFMILPVFQYREDLELSIRSNLYKKKQIERLGKEYKRFSTRSFSNNIKKNNQALFSVMDSLAGKTGVKDRIDYIKPSKEEYDSYIVEKVEIKLSEIDMKSLVSFLYEIESYGEHIKVKGLLIRRSEKSGVITSTIQAETVKSNA